MPCSYSLYERMRLLTEQSGGVIADTDFGTDVVLSVLMPSELVERFRANVTELSAGGVEVLVEERRSARDPEKTDNKCGDPRTPHRCSGDAVPNKEAPAGTPPGHPSRAKL